MGWEAQWQAVIVWAGVLSVLVGVLTLIAVPWVIIQLPADYFTRSHREVWRRSTDRSYGAWLLRLLKNLLGLVLVVLGFVMLVTPGQGLLTLLVGLLLMNFPGKYRLERWLVTRQGVLSGMNWLRRNQGKDPFQVPAGDLSGD